MKTHTRSGAVLAIATLLAAPTVTDATEAALLEAPFSDHAVLQREQPIRVWGRADPGEAVSVTLAGQHASAEADAEGRWNATLPPLPAGGPHSMHVSAASGAERTLEDVLIGDVFLCSGQSNMEFPVSRSLGGDAELRAPALDRIRLLTVEHAASPVPLERFAQPPAWQVAGPETVGGFSAACYYFARELRAHVDVPFGLIDASWGGSAIQAWTGEAGLRAAGGFDDWLDLLALYTRDAGAANRGMGERWQQWWHGHSPGSSPWLPEAGADAAWRDAPDGLGDWKQWGVPELANHHGMVWYRRRVSLTAVQAAQAAELSLGGIDEVDQTWVNGAPIGNTFGWGTERTYALPAGTLRAGENVVVTNVLNTWAAGGLIGPPERLALTLADDTRVALAGGWRYQVAPREHGYPPRAPWESIAGMTTLHGAMIAPLSGFGLRAALWYQGETNADAPEGYEQLLAALMSDWRGSFGAELPFLVVQLPGFGAVPTQPTEHNWADLRESQRRAVAADPHAALAVTIDVGDRTDLHPANKRDVGRRLARAARHLVYGESLTPSGPAPLGASREDGQVRVRFGDVEGELVAYGSDHAIAFELCGDDVGSCRYVAGEVQGNDVVLEVEAGASAERVRFCWGAAPLCNLYDGSGLPAGPFELDVASEDAASPDPSRR